MEKVMRRKALLEISDSKEEDEEEEEETSGEQGNVKPPSPEVSLSLSMTLGIFKPPSPEVSYFGQMGDNLGYRTLMPKRKKSPIKVSNGE